MPINKKGAASPIRFTTDLGDRTSILVEFPVDRDVPLAQLCQLLKGGGRQVEAVRRAARAEVADSGDDFLAIVWKSSG